MSDDTPIPEYDAARPGIDVPTATLRWRDGVLQQQWRDGYGNPYWAPVPTENTK